MWQGANTVMQYKQNEQHRLSQASTMQANMPADNHTEHDGQKRDSKMQRTMLPRSSIGVPITPMQKRTHPALARLRGRQEQRKHRSQQPITDLDQDIHKKHKVLETSKLNRHECRPDMKIKPKHGLMRKACSLNVKACKQSHLNAMNAYVLVNTKQW